MSVTSRVLLSATEGGFEVRGGDTASVFPRYEDAYRHARSLGQRVLDEARQSLLGARVRFTPSPQRAAMGGVVVEGVLVGIDPGSTGFRYRIQTDQKAPQGDGALEHVVWSSYGTLRYL